VRSQPRLRIIGLRVARELPVRRCSFFDAWLYYFWRADLGLAVADACKAARSDVESTFRFLYPLTLSLKEKIDTICREIYGADGADFSELAESRLQSYTASGFDKLPVCMAKTQYSLSTNAAAKVLFT
jgi:formyltetrahydrofolate synthetase